MRAEAQGGIWERGAPPVHDSPLSSPPSAARITTTAPTPARPGRSTSKPAGSEAVFRKRKVQIWARLRRPQTPSGSPLPQSRAPWPRPPGPCSGLSSASGSHTAASAPGQVTVNALWFLAAASFSPSLTPPPPSALLPLSAAPSVPAPRPACQRSGRATSSRKPSEPSCRARLPLGCPRQGDLRPGRVTLPCVCGGGSQTRNPPL